MTTDKPIIGFVGLGRLGTPLAVSIACQGYTVYGYDVNPAVMKKQPWPHREAGPDGDLGGEGFQPYFDKADLRYASLREVVDQADILFIAVQTPHHARYEGI